MQKNLIKKLVSLTFLSAITLLTLAITQATAYTIPSEYLPEGEPFDIGTQLEAGGASYGAVFILQIIAGGLLYFAAPVAILMIIFAAFMMVIGGAESEKRDQAKKHLTWAIIGLLIIIFSYSGVKFVIDIIFRAAST